MLTKINSYGIVGILGYPVTVEVDVSNGLPAFDIVGLPDMAVKEAKERIRSAIRNCGYSYPTQRITVNLAPADIRKEGSHYDLPMAVGLLCATKQIQSECIADYMFIGELSLNGSIRGVSGVLPMVIDAKSKGYHCIVVPKENAKEAAVVEGMHIYPAESLQEVEGFLNQKCDIPEEPTLIWEDIPEEISEFGDFSQIRGQLGAKRAMEIAAAGGHNILLIGPPGAGKTMLARSLGSILPGLTFEESLEVTKIQSVCGQTKREHCGIVKTRPFRAPHHSLSTAALTGGGMRITPGEVSLAHNGVLFLDELPEFRREALEALRQPIEDGKVTISRVNASVTYPARFMLVASMNPCPCGNFGTGECRCTPLQIQRYLNRISGPLLDRIDIHVEMGPVTYDQIASKGSEEPSAMVRERVQRAREIQTARYRQYGIHSNAQLDAQLTKQFCAPDEAGSQILKAAFSNLGLSARAYHRILKVARTIADLEQSESIQAGHIAEAVQYRNLDRKYWGNDR